jgi:hypothetical protein
MGGWWMSDGWAGWWRPEGERGYGGGGVLEGRGDRWAE